MNQRLEMIRLFMNISVSIFEMALSTIPGLLDYLIHSLNDLGDEIQYFIDLE